LRQTIPVIIEHELPRAQRFAAMALARHREQPLVDLKTLDYTEDQVLGDWCPDAP
jgi:hypothetical protein